MLSLLLALPALAATPAEPLPAALAPALRLSDSPTDTADGGGAPKTKRDFLMEVGFRGRYMTLPSGILDPWVESHTDSGETAPARPDINAYALGLEFIVKNESANGIFYVEYLNPLVQPGYWDDVDHGTTDDSDGSWIEPENLAVIDLGADYAYELHATPWLSFLFGGGLGVGFVLGDLKEWQPGEDPANPEGDNDNAEPDCGSNEAAYDRKDHCKVDSMLVADEKVWAALPFLDVNVGVRFNISNRAAIRLEGGFHDLFYGGASIGVVF